MFFLTISVVLTDKAVANNTLKEIFTEEYCCSTNESLLPNSQLIQELEQICNIYNLHHVVDIGCGDVKELSPSFKYTGIDIVDQIIENNVGACQMRQIEFECLDATQMKLPQGDLALCRNFFDYFSYFDIVKTLEKIKMSETTYLLVTTYPDYFNNTDTSTGIKRKINLQSYPFNLQKPIQLIPDEDNPGSFLGLWKTDQINIFELYKIVAPPLTVLSKPVGGELIWEHEGVMNSLRRGLPKLYQNFNINTDVFKLVKENVVVVADINAGLQAYYLREHNHIQTLMVGPNIVSNLYMANSFIARPLINAFLSPSDWPGKTIARVHPSLQGRIYNWPAGVDENYWKPVLKFPQKSKKNVLVYCKTHPELSHQVINILNDRGYSVSTITYGNYLLEEFKKALSCCSFAIFVSISESQGIALAEAWCMDVPTLVWNPRASVLYEGVEWQNTSACPYLTPMTGKDWSNLDELEKLLIDFEAGLFEFQPRKWVLLNMTDKVSSEKLLDLVRQEQKKPTNPITAFE